jgi:hypothetical protein
MSNELVRFKALRKEAIEKGLEAEAALRSIVRDVKLSCFIPEDELRGILGSLEETNEELMAFFQANPQPGDVEEGFIDPED